MSPKSVDMAGFMAGGVEQGLGRAQYQTLVCPARGLCDSAQKHRTCSSQALRPYFAVECAAIMSGGGEEFLGIEN